MSAIFKRDFRGYFTTPIGYIYVGGFLLLMNLYFYFLGNIMSSYPYISGTFNFMLLIMIVSTPILTMRTFSEEFRQKTDQLLLTSPVKLTSIVLGKFFAAYAVFCTFMIFTLIWIFIISILGEPNTAEVVGSYVAMLAIAGVYISIGMFVSSLTENQIVAAFGSMAIFAVLYVFDLLVTVLAASIPGWFSSVLSFISIFSRYNAITLGVFSVADIFFFLSFTAVFLFLTVRVLEKKRWS